MRSFDNFALRFDLNAIFRLNQIFIYSVTKIRLKVKSYLDVAELLYMLLLRPLGLYT